MLISPIQMKAWALKMIDFRMSNHNKCWSTNVLGVQNDENKKYSIESLPEWVR